MVEKFEVIEENFSTTKRVIICDDLGNEVGSCLIYVLSDDCHSKPFGLLSAVFVKPEFRSGGFGTKLVKEAIRCAREDFGCYKLVCTSRAGRGIVDWYKKLGFEEKSIGFRIDFDTESGDLK